MPSNTFNFDGDVVLRVGEIHSTDQAPSVIDLVLPGGLRKSPSPKETQEAKFKWAADPNTRMLLNQFAQHSSPAMSFPQAQEHVL